MEGLCPPMELESELCGYHEAFQCLTEARGNQRQVARYCGQARASEELFPMKESPFRGIVISMHRARLSPLIDMVRDGCALAGSVLLRKPNSLRRRNLLDKPCSLGTLLRMGVALLALCLCMFIFASSSDALLAQAPAPTKGGQAGERRDSQDQKQKILPPTTSAELPSSSKSYKVGVEDELQISVWREPELSTSVVVRPDGMITLPLLNDVKAAGLRCEELQTLLTEKLKSFVNEPQVTVIVKTIRSRKVYLVGNVARQGSYSLNGDMTVLELLAASGGLGTFAKGESIYVLREENGKKVRLPFHYKKAVAGKSENLVLAPGDVVVVP